MSKDGIKYFLAKTDPDTYSIEDFEKEAETIWDGVHNHQAINVIKTMSPGDIVYIYHSMQDKSIVGLAEVAGEPFENTSDPRFSWAVRMKFIKRTNPVTLKEIKAEPLLGEFLLVRHSRLSTMPVPNDVANWLNDRI
jgi:predicted RNA-binding protein with PUA-like domain